MTCGISISLCSSYLVPVVATAIHALPVRMVADRPRAKDAQHKPRKSQSTAVLVLTVVTGSRQATAVPIVTVVPTVMAVLAAMAVVTVVVTVVAMVVVTVVAMAVVTELAMAIAI